MFDFLPNRKRMRHYQQRRTSIAGLSQNEIVRYALNNGRQEEQGVPDMRAIWIVLHYGSKARV
jgi:hypothetical protein